MNSIILSFHVIVSVCNTMNGACTVLETLGPYAAKATNGSIKSSACGSWGQIAMIQSQSMLKKLEKLHLTKDQRLDIECDSSQMARL